MHNSESPSLGQLGQHLSAIRRRSQQRKLLRQTVAFAIGLLLMVLAMLATGCASPPPPPSEPLEKTQPPALTQPLPSVSYSKQAQALIESWQKRVIGMSATSKP